MDKAKEIGTYETSILPYEDCCTVFLPKYPAINRDLAFVMNKEYLVSEIKARISTLAGDLLESIQIFDVYQGKGIEENKKSVAFSLVFRADDRTLNDQEINLIIEKIISEMSKIEITLRK